MPLEEVMVRDVFPAEVSLSDGRMLTQVRAFVTTERLVVWRQNPDRSVRRALDIPIRWSSSERSRATLGPNERIEVHGEEVTAMVNRGKGCGCGSVLKALSTPAPWKRKARV